ncbi:prephenate dehydratase [Candidatus Bathyarchaeota archaeon]|nr:prephenate dehydratase [Candidatus Bathyarchaeota archaeon]
MRVAYQGEPGAYSEEAIIKHWGDEAQPVPLPYLQDVFAKVEQGGLDLGLVPVENTIQGSIHLTYDLLLDSELTIQGETILRINHSLIVNPGTKLEEIKRVFSHPQAIGQSRDFIEKYDLESVSTYDTAGSVKMIKEMELRDAAAIASRRAAEVYSMEILAEGIETHQENYTRFLIIGKGKTKPTGRDKTTLSFITEHKPGSLLKALHTISDQGINLLKIESRPLIGKPWEYIFYVEFEGHEEDLRVKKSLDDLENVTTSIKKLGSYPQASFLG